jgi:hypothetical protein
LLSPTLHHAIAVNGTSTASTPADAITRQKKIANGPGSAPIISDRDYREGNRASVAKSVRPESLPGGDLVVRSGAPEVGQGAQTSNAVWRDPSIRRLVNLSCLASYQSASTA